MSLADRLKAEIAAGGPITVADYMRRCLHDPQDGYYATRPALGADGDFITAPLVSQMFGELIGLWVVETWRAWAGPRGVLLVEIGPGDGTLMSDVLRAARLAPGFLAAAEVWLVETSAPLAARQRRAAGSQGPAAALDQPARGPAGPARRCCWSPTSCSTACPPASSCARRAAGPSGWWAWTRTASSPSASRPAARRPARPRRRSRAR